MSMFPGLQQAGDAILEAILSAIKIAATIKIQEDYADWVQTLPAKESQRKV
jgi:hypothetical protein